VKPTVTITSICSSRRGKETASNRRSCMALRNGALTCHFAIPDLGLRRLLFGVEKYGSACYYGEHPHHPHTFVGGQHLVSIPDGSVRHLPRPNRQTTQGSGPRPTPTQNQPNGDTIRRCCSSSGRPSQPHPFACRHGAHGPLPRRGTVANGRGPAKPIHAVYARARSMNATIRSRASLDSPHLLQRDLSTRHPLPRCSFSPILCWFAVGKFQLQIPCQKITHAG